MFFRFGVFMRFVFCGFVRVYCFLVLGRIFISSKGYVCGWEWVCELGGAEVLFVY